MGIKKSLETHNTNGGGVLYVSPSFAHNHESGGVKLN